MSTGDVGETPPGLPLLFCDVRLGSLPAEKTGGRPVFSSTERERRSCQAVWRVVASS